MSKDFRQFFSERISNLPPPNEKGECVVPCIFHEDKSPSLAVNVQSGKWKCYTPHCIGHRGGGWKKFDALLKGEVIGADVQVKPIDVGTLEGFHRALLACAAPMEILRVKRGLSDETIKKYKLGWDSDRILIPILGPDGSYINVRKYKYGATEDKMIAWGVGYNRARLFPYENLKSDWVLLCEGEMDAMIACQMGFPAITVTSGADTWMEEFNQQLAGKRVVICYDADHAGRKGAQQVALKLLATAKEVRILKLPLAGSKEEKDVSDYFVRLKHTAAEFQALVDAAEQVVPMVTQAPPPAEVRDLHLSDIGLDEHVGKRVRSTVLIAGKDLAPFQVPYRIGYACDAVGSEKMCDRCGICKANGQLEVKLPEWSPDLLQMINVPVEKLHAVVGKLAGVPDRCPKYKYEVKEHTNVESIKAIPEIDFNADHAEYVIRNLFYLGHGIETNHTYRIEAVVMPEPKTQYATALIYNAEPAQDSIEKFELVDSMLGLLSIFKVTE